MKKFIVNKTEWIEKEVLITGEVEANSYEEAVEIAREDKDSQINWSYDWRGGDNGDTIEILYWNEEFTKQID